MKRSLGTSEPLAPLCQSGFQSLLDGLDDDDDLVGVGEGAGAGGAQSSEKKRRLSADQVRALEKNFEVENKLEPERKARLAQELGLQPRQVAVWFQNRRARWKTKQLERDYGALKSRYDSLRLDYESILRDKDSLLAEVKELKAKLTAGGEESFSSIKEEPVASESENKATLEEEAALTLIYGGGGGAADSSDSSAVENSPLISSSAAGAVGFAGGVSFGVNYFQPPVMMKAEEGEFLGAGEEPCSSFFAEDQPPTLAWYCGAGWE